MGQTGKCEVCNKQVTIYDKNYPGVNSTKLICQECVEEKKEKLK